MLACHAMPGPTELMCLLYKLALTTGCRHGLFLYGCPESGRWLHSLFAALFALQVRAS